MLEEREFLRLFRVGAGANFEWLALGLAALTTRGQRTRDSRV